MIKTRRPKITDQSLNQICPATPRYQNIGASYKGCAKSASSALALRALELAKEGKLRVSIATGCATGYPTEFDHEYFREDVIRALVTCQKIRLQPYDRYQDLAVVL